MRFAPRTARLALLFGTLAGPALGAQELPPADALIDRYVEAIGGRDVVLAPRSMRMTGVFSMPGLGIEGDFETLTAAPDLASFSVTIPGFAEQSSGYDGEVGWSYSNLTGPMILEGAQLNQVREEANVLASVRDPILIPGRETLGLVDFEGQPCWRVHLTWTSGRESFDCYSPETGLLIASEMVEASPMGDVPVISLFSDYQEYSGIMLPTRMVQRTLGQEQVVTVRAVELNGVDRSDLDPPPAIQALLETAAQ